MALLPLKAVPYSNTLPRTVSIYEMPLPTLNYWPSVVCSLFFFLYHNFCHGVGTEIFLGGFFLLSFKKSSNFPFPFHFQSQAWLSKSG